VYETDESLSGSAYVLGGHMSHVSKASAEGRSPHRVSVGPLFFCLLGVLVLLLLSLLIVPRIRRRAAIYQSS